MKKLFGIIILLLVIVLSFGFVLARWQAQGSDDNSFNKIWRSQTASHPWLRSLLGLHDFGDARTDFLGSRYSKILIEVDEMEGLEMSRDALSVLAVKIENTTGKETSYIVSDRNLPYSDYLSSQQIETMADRYRGYESSGDTVTIHLLFVSRDAEEKDSLGQTYRESGMVLFGGRLAEFAEASPTVLPDYEQSTALHEFGHLLGLPHNQEAGCVMNESAEQAHVVVESSEDVVNDFCDYEKQLIRNY